MLALQRQLEKRDGECDGRFVYVSRSQFVEEMGKTNRQAAVIYTAHSVIALRIFQKARKDFCFEKFNY